MGRLGDERRQYHAECSRMFIGHSSHDLGDRVDVGALKNTAAKSRVETRDEGERCRPLEHRVARAVVSLRCCRDVRRSSHGEFLQSTGCIHFEGIEHAAPLLKPRQKRNNRGLVDTSEVHSLKIAEDLFCGPDIHGSSIAKGV